MNRVKIKYTRRHATCLANLGPRNADAHLLTSGFDALASLFGLRVAQPGNSNVAVRGTLSREEEQQAFLSRVLLLLGSLVIMCLLIF